MEVSRPGRKRTGGQGLGRSPETACSRAGARKEGSSPPSGNSSLQTQAAPRPQGQCAPTRGRRTRKAAAALLL